jgi:hypothetical protein
VFRKAISCSPKPSAKSSKGQKREAPAPKAAKGNFIDLVAALQESLGSVKKRQKTLCRIAHPLMVKSGWNAQTRPSAVSKGACIANPLLYFPSPTLLAGRWCIRCSPKTANVFGARRFMFSVRYTSGSLDTVDFRTTEKCFARTFQDRTRRVARNWLVYRATSDHLHRDH